MHLLAISLLTILAGTLLLAKFKKEAAGKLFSIISWFFVVVGFLLFIGFIGGAICKFSHHGSCCETGMQQEMMMKECGPGMHGHGMGCAQGMHGYGMGCPQGMEKGMCQEKPGCMPKDSAMKCCPEHMMKCDSVKAPVKK